jgi:hypothetical protein
VVLCKLEKHEKRKGEKEKNQKKENPKEKSFLVNFVDRYSKRPKEKINQRKRYFVPRKKADRKETCGNDSRIGTPGRFYYSQIYINKYNYLDRKEVIPEMEKKPRKKSEYNGIKNLKPITERSPEERAALGRKGGLKAQECNRQRRTAQEIMQLLLNSKISRAQAQEKLGEYAQFLPEEATLYDLVNLRQIMESLEGSYKSAEYVRDTSGDKPIERQEISAEIMSEADRALMEQIAQRIGLNPAGDGKKS